MRGEGARVGQIQIREAVDLEECTGDGIVFVEQIAHQPEHLDVIGNLIR